ncbi:hypothetical protein FDA94_28750 [Herbidospora galbida]|uniref:Uncharacterized protein n=1 Tax=Herbidospora galbida TaxID=2575442 RepID=A0A4U3M736_9ACTN|nr:hypothetical protein [Herbidospora galbida]TKK84621.1 hypothetical protein FDA94_28750 [Herbidospora galbida]
MTAPTPEPGELRDDIGQAQVVHVLSPPERIPINEDGAPAVGLPVMLYEPNYANPGAGPIKRQVVLMLPWDEASRLVIDITRLIVEDSSGV